MHRFLPLLAASLLLAAAARAEDWPQFLGPRRDNTSNETVKPWTGDPKVLWRVAVGEGHSSPVVAGRLVFLHDKVEGKNIERLSVFDAVTGMPLASTEQERGEFSSTFGVGPRATPAVVGDRIYTFGVTGRFSATTFARSGNAVSLKSAFFAEPLADFKAKNLTFGVSSSPLIEGELAIVLAGGKNAGVVAYNRTTGRVAWKALDEPASYASPVAVGEGTKRQIVVLTQKGLAGLSPKDGAVIWHHPFQDALNESSTTPVKVGELLIASSVTLGSVALKMTEKGGKVVVDQVWKKPELNCYFSTPVPVGKDHLYMINGVLGLRPSIILRCVETSTGKTLWSKSNIGKYHAALLRTADDKLLMLDDGGHLTLLEPNAKEYKELARSKVCGETWAHPALSNGRLYLRDAKELICIELAK